MRWRRWRNSISTFSTFNVKTSAIRSDFDFHSQQHAIYFRCSSEILIVHRFFEVCFSSFLILLYFYWRSHFIIFISSLENKTRKLNPKAWVVWVINILCAPFVKIYFKNIKRKFFSDTFFKRVSQVNLIDFFF